jgi:glycosyltransferase involved in cell wall biosynthesis
MRILLVGDYPNDARLGSTKVFVKLQEEFRALGHTCDMLLAEELGLRPRNRFARQLVEPIAALAAVRRAIRKSGPYDIVDVASAEGLWLAALRRARRTWGPSSGGPTAIIARSNGLEHLNYKRMLDDDSAGLWRKPMTRRWWYPAVRLSQVALAARLADRLIVLNDIDREFAVSRRWKPSAEIDLVGHGVSARFLTDAPAADHPRGRGILFCGTWDHMKGIHYLTAAFSSLVLRGRTTNLTILGGGVPEASIRAGFSADAQKYLTIVDRVSEAEVIAAYRAHDVMAFTSSYEGFGMVLLETMTQRLPVVSTPVGCARALVSDERTGLLVPCRDADALAAALGRMLDDCALRTSLADRAFDTVRDMTWTRSAVATLAVYERAQEIRGRH